MNARDGGVIGKTLGSHRIIGLIGEGGMGAVYLAEHTVIGRKAAIKVLHPAAAADPVVVERFMDEARAANQIQHPGIVEIYDLGREPDVGAYLVMEYLKGESLERRLRRERALRPTQAVKIAQRVAGALAAAHASGIVHRDLKPENIFIVGDPDHPTGERVKVLDFGIAKLGGDRPSVARTRTGTVMGTPLYMSPEQCHGAKHVDRRSDIYSLGTIVYEMLCGRPPFVAEGFGELLSMNINAAPPPPTTFHPKLPRPLEQVVLRALEKDPGARQQTMEELSRALGAAVDGLAESADVAGPASRGHGATAVLPDAAGGDGPPPPPPSTMSASAAELVRATSGRRRLLLAAAAVGAGVLIAVAAAIGLDSADDAGDLEDAADGITGAPAGGDEPAPAERKGAEAAPETRGAGEAIPAEGGEATATASPETADHEASAALGPSSGKPRPPRADRTGAASARPPGAASARPTGAPAAFDVAVGKTLAGAKGRLKACGRGVATDVTVDFAIDAAGKATKVVPRAPHTFSDEGACVIRVLMGVAFPRPAHPPAALTRTFEVVGKKGGKSDTFVPPVR